MSDLSKNKYEFINELIANPKLNISQKERVLKLTASELIKDYSSQGEIKKRLEVLEEKLGVETSFLEEPDKTPQKIEEPEADYAAAPPKIKPHKSKQDRNYHHPLDTKNFLTLFKNSEYIKYLTHRFNSSRPDYDEFMAGCKREFKEALTNYPNTSDRVWRRVEEFAFKKSPNWFITEKGPNNDQHKGWSEPEFIKWYKSSNAHPLDNARWKKTMIDPFKSTIEVRAGSFTDIINEQKQKAFGEDINKFEFIESERNLAEAEFYTNVDMLEKSIYLIFCQIKEIAERNKKYKIGINYLNDTLENGVYKNLIITHYESLPTKAANDPNFAKGDLISIRNSLWGLANYEIAALFEGGPMKRIISTNDLDLYTNHVKTSKPILLNRKLKGFTHIIKFY